ncbi:zinc finger and BTB domain-containing protein 7B isoform X2 [Xiphias gladius]|nr:zinc finger and BTB domain-containing protein 7B isoform X2 [Xiphias gladius]XP_039972816.1 zinc finger and BTB domain-containing protein 7B isoform X2 [Xiphias gladius]XP_039972817.1 zinc finger and BTB domain-containing protein 7B isoform X2 [Xiphias gladius]XP_039972818.1 zinc finger and BTB domain-containing protein 7B isoform X2 [Xiphias gladius]
MSPGEDGLIGIPFPEHSNELLSHLNDQRRTGLLCDLTLTSHGARYPTHRSVMAAVSLYFRRLFGAEEGGSEGGGGFSVCQLDCVAPDALDALLEFAYTATLTIPSSGMRDVLRGAQLLGIQCVADACRDILGETAEAEGETAEEQRAQHTASKRMLEGESGVEKGSRRKTDKKRVKKLGLHYINPSVLNPSPASPVSHPSPPSDSVHSLPSTQPPSPEQEDLRLKSGQNGDPRSIREPGRVSARNGGLLHWLHERPRIAHPPPVVPLNDKLSEDDDMEGFGDDGMLMVGTSIPTSVNERGAATSAMGGGRKRKSQTPQQCPVCQKIIHGAGKLPRHMRTHTGEKPFQCSACGVRFTRNDKLKIHMRKHTGERPYPCPHCPARFLHSYDLKNHLSLHSGARPFECPLCHKAFAREDHLQRHRKGHSCLELRTRRPRRGPDLLEDGRGDEGRREQSNPLEALTSQAHSSAFLPHTVLDGGNGSGVGPPLLFPGDIERGRSLAFQALAQLGPAHRLAGYPEFFLRGMELRGGREAEGEDPGGTHSPAAQRDRWADEVEEEIGDEEAEEEE